MATGKAELAKSIAQKTGVTQKQAAEFITAMLDTIQEKLMEGDKVQLVGFGTFTARRRESREGRRPGTDEKIIIPARTVPVFKAGKVFKEKLNIKDE
ncbi:MAG TPA: HU family DNA-binding protein [Firmicutes bacterium]|nr:HU family DNA-binding protein [Bacillota bacterium]